MDVIHEKCAYLKGGKSLHCKERTNDAISSIVAQFQRDFRGNRRIPPASLQSPRGREMKPLVAQWGGISLARDTEVVLSDCPLTI